MPSSLSSTSMDFLEDKESKEEVEIPWWCKFKTIKCDNPKHRPLCPRSCKFSGRYEDLRRPVFRGGILMYSSTLCTHVKNKRRCPLGNACQFAHNKYEQKYHPSVYRTGTRCKHEVCECPETCSFWHTEDEKRVYRKLEAGASQRDCLSKDSVEGLKLSKNWLKYKTVECDKESHRDPKSPERKKCPFFHSAREQRRPLFSKNGLLMYIAVKCRFFDDPDKCRDGNKCVRAHNVNELCYHPSTYKTIECSDGKDCVFGERCSKWHSEEERRVKRIYEFMERNVLEKLDSQLASARSSSGSEADILEIDDALLEEVVLLKSESTEQDQIDLSRTESEDKKSVEHEVEGVKTTSLLDFGIKESVGYLKNLSDCMKTRTLKGRNEVLVAVIEEKVSSKVLKKEVAVKRILKSQLHSQKRFEREVTILYELNKKAPGMFVELVDWGQDKDFYYILTQLYDTDLEHFYRNSKLSVSERRRMCKDLIEIVAYMHKSNHTHRDIKPANVLLQITPDSKIERLVLSDCDCSKLVDRSLVSSTQTQLVATFDFRSPEFIDLENECKKYPGEDCTVSNELYFGMDVFAAALTCYCILTGEYPFPDRKTTLAKYSDGEIELPCHRFLSPIAYDFLRTGLDRDYRSRPTADQLLKHPFLYFDSDDYECLPNTLQQVFASDVDLEKYSQALIGVDGLEEEKWHHRIVKMHDGDLGDYFRRMVLYPGVKYSDSVISFAKFVFNTFKHIKDLSWTAEESYQFADLIGTSKEKPAAYSYFLWLCIHFPQFVLVTLKFRSGFFYEIWRKEASIGDLPRVPQITRKSDSS